MTNVIKTVLTYQLDGSTRDFNIPFEYLARKFVVVTLIGVDRKVLTINTDYRFATRTTISLTKAWGPADGYTTIELRRVTSTTDRLVDFTDGSILRAYDLNVAQIQTMHVAEEARDLTADTIGVNNDGHLDARGRRIVNLANAVDDHDAVPLGQLKVMDQSSWQARNEALQFRNEAETFRNQAEGFKNESGTNATNTYKWRNEAEGFRDEAEQFKNASGQYADAAGSYAGNAKDSEDEARRIAASIRAAGLFGYITRQSFEKGFNLTVWNEVLLWEEEGEYYRWDGTLPKDVPAGSTPETSGGIGLGAWVSVGDAALRSQIANPEGAILYPELHRARWLDEKDVRGWGAKGDGVTDDTAALTSALNDTPVGQKLNGNGKTYKVTSLPDISRFINTRFVYERIPGQPLYYVSEEFVQGELFKITDTPYYNAWPQDKAFVYENVIYAPYMGSDRHGVSRLHVSWVKSGDDGQTWSTPEWLTDLHPEYPTVNYHCMSMGVCRNRLFAMIETRTLAKNKLTNCALWDRPMSRSLHLTGGITKAANQRYATIHVPDHGLFVGDFVNFSNSAVTGVSGDMKVATVIDKDNFTVLTSNQQTSDLNNAGKNWHMGTSFHKSPWRKTDLGLIPRVTEVHSFSAIDNNGFVMGYHQGDVAPREVGLFYFPNAFDNPAKYVRRQIPSEYEPDAAEPCIKYYDGVLYLITRGTRSDRLGSSLHRSRDIGQTWESLRFPHNVHHTTLPFAKVGDELIMFGSERAENEWEAGAPDDRYKASYPRTFYARLNVNKWSADDIEWVNITDQIYQGGIVNSGVGVGSVVVKDSYIYYIFGGEDHLNPWTYGDNSAKDPFKSDGHPSDLYCYKMKIGPDNRVSRDFRYGAVPNRAVPVFFDTNGIRTVPAPMEFTGDLGLGHVTIRASTSRNIRSEVLMEGEYGFIGKSIPTDNPAGQRIIFCGGEGTSSTTGAQITLYGANNTDSKRIVYNGAEHLFQSADVKPYNDNVTALGGPHNRFTTAYLGSNPIVTSNGEKKTEPVVFDDAFLDAWGDVRYIMYQWLDAVQLKGNDARIHFGVIAQQIRDVFIAHGLMDENSTDCRYAVLCYDKYPRMTDTVFSHNEIVEHTDEEGNVTITEEPVYTEVVIHEEGEEWGVRPDGIFFAEAAYQRRKLERIEARLSALEQKY